ncbi:hypothetical protein VTN96DRAFT_6504 [Rasamsonia emersonii]
MKIPACQRLVVSEGKHVHILGPDLTANKSSKLCRWFHRKTVQTDEQEALLKPARPTRPQTTATFAERYGRCKRIIHYGKTSTVRLYRKSPSQVYAVKVFRRSCRNVDPRRITTALDHPHIVETIDLVRNNRGDLCLVMEFCAGGDLLALLMASDTGKLERVEADCFFKQLMRGVDYLHENGIAHGNLTSESILLTANGCVKIADFDASRLPRYLSSPSSLSYIAPEVYTHRRVDLRTGDIWACGIIYLAMRTGYVFWSVAREGDAQYDEYVKRRAKESFGPIEALEERSCRNVIYAMLDPNHTRRITASQALRSEWVYSIVVCDAGERGL